MKFQFLWKYFLFGLLISLLFNYKTFYTTSTTTTKTSTTTQEIVKKGNISSSIEVVGEANLVDEQSLRFNKVGKITKVYFKEGESVKKGQIIAELDSKEAESSIKEADLSLENAEISLKQLYEWVDQSQILQSKNTILNSENSLDTSSKEFETLKISNQNTLNEKQKEIDLQKKELENLKSSYVLAEQELETLKKEQNNNLNTSVANKGATIIDIEESFRSNIAQIDEIIREADYIMGVSEQNKEKNDNYEMFLWAENATIKSKTEFSLIKSIDLFETLKKSYANYDESGEKAKLLHLLNEFNSMYDELYITIDGVYNTAENSIPSEGALGESDISAIKTKMSAYRNTILSKISAINKSIATLSTLSDTELLAEGNNNTIAQKTAALKTSALNIEKKQKEIEGIQSDFDIAKMNLSIQETTKERDISSKKNSLEIAKISLDELIEWPTSENVKKAQNTIRQAQIRLESAQDSLEDYQLIAPFDGVIRKIDYKVGDNLTSDVEKYVYIENPNLLEINVMLDQIDITKVKMGQDAMTVFDAYPTIKVASKISVIDTTPVQSSGVVSYQVKLVLDDPLFDKEILSGMTANITIVTESRRDVLTLTSSAISESNGKSYVILLENNLEKKVEIKTGMTSAGVTEIISGVKEGDTLIVKDFSVSTEKTSGTSLFSPPTSTRRNTNSSTSGWAGGPPPF